jgi:hypothetical protein
VTNAAFNAAHALGAITLSATTASFATDQSTAATAFVLTNSSALSGPGVLTNDGSIMVQSSTIKTTFVNRGALFVEGSSALTGTVTSDTGSRIRVEGNGKFGTGALSITSDVGLLNNGIIELTDVGSAFGATLKIPLGSLQNSSSGLIDAQAGANGPRNLEASLDNQGMVAVHARLSVRANAVNGTGGKIFGDGMFDVIAPATFLNFGQIMPGKSPGVLTVGGDPQLDSTSVVSIEIGGIIPGLEYDQLAITGRPALDGTLDVVLIGGFVPKVGDEFRVVTYSSFTGPGFRPINLPPLPNGLVWSVDTQSDPKALILRVIVG